MTLKRCLLATATMLLGATTGCSSVDPGDYVVYRISATQPTPLGDCKVDPNDANDSSSLRLSATIVLFAGEEGTFYLDVGGRTLEGEEVKAEVGNGYEFEGEKVDVEYADPKGTGPKFVTTTRFRVTMTVDSESVTGIIKSKLSLACSGSGCPVIGDPCTMKSTFVGVEVDDLELQHGV